MKKLIRSLIIASGGVFPVKLFTLKRNLVFMNNLYHKVAVASVCTALGFAIGATKEAKAATFNSFFPYPLITFQAYDGGSFGSFDGLGDTVDSVTYPDVDSGRRHSWYVAERTTAREIAALTEFSISNCKDSGLKKGNEFRLSQVTRMGRNSLTEKSHY